MKPRYKVFADEWLRNGNNATKAYLTISPNVTAESAATEGKKYLRKPEIKEYIELKQAKTAEKRQIDYEWLLEQQEFILNLALIKEKANEHTGEVEANPDLTNANKAIDQLSKLIGAYAPTKTDNKHSIEEIPITKINLNE